MRLTLWAHTAWFLWRVLCDDSTNIGLPWKLLSRLMRISWTRSAVSNFCAGDAGLGLEHIAVAGFKVGQFCALFPGIPQQLAEVLNKNQARQTDGRLC